QRIPRIQDRSGGQADAQERRQGGEAFVRGPRADRESQRAPCKDIQVSEANGRCEREVALEMIDAHIDREGRRPRRSTEERPDTADTTPARKVRKRIEQSLSDG